VRDAEEDAAARLAPAPAAPRVLTYDGENCEFVELRPDGLRALRALERAGDLGALLATLPADGPARDRARAFATDLHRLGVLAPRAHATLTPKPRAPRSTHTPTENTHAR
jgi:hypothetical protein